MSAKPTSRPVFDQVVEAETTYYIPIPCFDAKTVSIMMQWDDATLDVGTPADDIVIETTDDPDVALDSTDADAWYADEELTGLFTGPDASTRRCERRTINGVGARRMRLKIEFSAVASTSRFKMRVHGKT